jgi:hypothetical protein
MQKEKKNNTYGIIYFNARQTRMKLLLLHNI